MRSKARLHLFIARDTTGSNVGATGLYATVKPTLIFGRRTRLLHVITHEVPHELGTGAIVLTRGLGEGLLQLLINPQGKVRLRQGRHS